MRKPTRIVVIIWFLVLVAGPLVAYLLGARGRAIENRPLASAPDLAASDVLETETYDEITNYFTDHVPAREQAVRADAWIDLRVFGDSPNPDAVWIGSDGWLYLPTTFRRPCETPAPPAEIVDRLGRIGRVVEASGRDFVLAVAPNKEALYPEHLGDLEEEQECVAGVRADTRAALAATPPPGYIDMWAVLEEAKPDAAEPLYYPNDSHWTTWSGALLASQVMEAVEPGLWDETATATYDQEREGDLTLEMGLPYTYSTVGVEVARPGVTVQQLDDSPPTGPNEYQAETTEPVVEARLVAWHDSFVNVVEPMLNLYFDESLFTHWRTLPLDETATSIAAATLPAADVVFIETTERALYGRFGTSYVDMPAQTVAALAAELPRSSIDLESVRTAGLERQDGALVAADADPVLRVPIDPAPSSDRYLIVTLTPADSGNAVVAAAGAGTSVPVNVTGFPLEAGVETTIVADLSVHPEADTVVVRPGPAEVTAVELVVLSRPYPAVGAAS